MEQQSAKNPMLRVMSLRDFRILFSGSATSLLGDQFTLIATPWLVLQLTGDPLTLGIVLALEGIPRAVFMLMGGAITDRFSPQPSFKTFSESLSSPQAGVGEPGLDSVPRRG